MKALFLLIALVGVSASLNAQSTSSDLVEVDFDKNELYAMTDTVLSAISGPKTKQRNFQQFRNQFTPDATIETIVNNQELGTVELKSLTIKEFIDANKNFYAKNDFWELPVNHHVTVVKGGYVLVDQLYEIFLANPETSNSVITGINSFSFVQKNGQWKIERIIYKSYKDLDQLPEYFR